MKPASQPSGGSSLRVMQQDYLFYFKLPWLLLSLLIGTKALSTTQGVCIQVVYGNYYQLTGLEATQDMVLDVSNTPGRIIFNMCRYVESRCPGYNNSFAIYKDENICIPLTTDSITQRLSRALMPLKANTTNETTGLNMTFTGLYRVDSGKPNSTLNYSIQLLMDCNNTVKDAPFNWTAKQPVAWMDNGTIVVYGVGPQACPIYSGAFLLDFLHKFFYYIAALAIVVGIIECFYGVRLFKFTMFVTGFLVGFIIMAIFLYIIWNVPDAPAYKGYVIVAFAVLTGLMIGFLVASIAWIGLVLAGSLLGFFASMLLFSTFLSSVVSLPPNLVLYNTIAWGMVLGSILGFELQNQILNISCSFSGAYLAIRGISFYVGGFPSEFTSTGLTSDTTTTEDTNTNLRWVYYGAIFVLTAVGIFVQDRHLKSDQELRSIMEAQKRQLDANVHYQADMREMTPLEAPLLNKSDEELDPEEPAVVPKKTPNRKKTVEESDSDESPVKSPAKAESGNKSGKPGAKGNSNKQPDTDSSSKRTESADKPKIAEQQAKSVKTGAIGEGESAKAKAKKIQQSEDEDEEPPVAAKPAIKTKELKTVVATKAVSESEDSEPEIAPKVVKTQKPEVAKNEYKSGVSKLFSSIEPKNEDESDAEDRKPPKVEEQPQARPKERKAPIVPPEVNEEIAKPKKAKRSKVEAEDPSETRITVQRDDSRVGDEAPMQKQKDKKEKKDRDRSDEEPPKKNKKRSREAEDVGGGERTTAAARLVESEVPRVEKKAKESKRDEEREVVEDREERLEKKKEKKEKKEKQDKAPAAGTEEEQLRGELKKKRKKEKKAEDD